MTSQVEVLFPLWDNIEWFVIGGTADCDEAQAVAAKFSETKCFGVEPNLTFANMQRNELKFPGRVINAALWSSDDDALPLTMPSGGTERSATVCQMESRPDAPGRENLPVAVVNSITLDSLSDQYGPFNNVALWLDIEFAEVEALKGATQLLKRTKLINLETFAHGNLAGVLDILYPAGFRLKKVWNFGTVAGRDAQDYVFVKELT